MVDFPDAQKETPSSGGKLGVALFSALRPSTDAALRGTIFGETGGTTDRWNGPLFLDLGAPRSISRFWNDCEPAVRSQRREPDYFRLLFGR